MTPEQKFLKALAEWLDIKTCPKNRIQMASREYLDQFREVKEKVDQFTDVSKKVEPEPAWKPEVCMLSAAGHQRFLIHEFHYQIHHIDSRQLLRL